MKNKQLAFTKKRKEHQKECGICGGRALVGKGVAVQWQPNESPAFAAVYCRDCVKMLAFAAELL